MFKKVKQKSRFWRQLFSLVLAVSVFLVSAGFVLAADLLSPTESSITTGLANNPEQSSPDWAISTYTDVPSSSVPPPKTFGVDAAAKAKTSVTHHQGCVRSGDVEKAICNAESELQLCQDNFKRSQELEKNQVVKDPKNYKIARDCINTILDGTFKTAKDQAKKAYEDCLIKQKDDPNNITCYQQIADMEDISKAIYSTKSALNQIGISSNSVLSVMGQGHFASVKGLLGTAIDFLVKLIGTVALVFLTIGGMWLILAAGNDSQIQKAKDVIRYAIVGLIVALVAYIAVAAVQALLYK